MEIGDRAMGAMGGALADRHPPHALGARKPDRQGPTAQKRRNSAPLGQAFQHHPSNMPRRAITKPQNSAILAPAPDLALVELPGRPIGPQADAATPEIAKTSARPRPRDGPSGLEVDQVDDQGAISTRQKMPEPRKSKACAMVMASRFQPEPRQNRHRTTKQLIYI